MSNKQETVVEWLNEQLQNNVHHTIRIPLDIIQKAKEMHRQQAIKLYYEYELYVMMNESDVMTFGQFYEQTYGGGNK